MTSTRESLIPAVVAQKPLQTGKFVGIVLALVLGIAGFLRLIDARALVDNPMLGDGQFLSLLLIPLLGIGLVCLVFLETLYAGYRSLKGEKSISDQFGDRRGYIILRGVEAGIAVLGVLIMAAAIPPLFAESTPSPAGVGIMLLLMGVGLLVLVTSLIRSGVELFLDPRSN